MGILILNRPKLETGSSLWSSSSSPMDRDSIWINYIKLYN